MLFSPFFLLPPLFFPPIFPLRLGTFDGGAGEQVVWLTKNVSKWCERRGRGEKKREKGNGRGILLTCRANLLHGIFRKPGVTML